MLWNDTFWIFELLKFAFFYKCCSVFFLLTKKFVPLANKRSCNVKERVGRIWEEALP